MADCVDWAGQATVVAVCSSVVGLKENFSKLVWLAGPAVIVCHCRPVGRLVGGQLALPCAAGLSFW